MEHDALCISTLARLVRQVKQINGLEAHEKIPIKTPATLRGK
jgi:hypothetical protein